MAHLRKHARAKRKEETSKTLSAYLPASTYDEFAAYCEELGLSLSEATFLLIEEELRSKDKTTAPLILSPITDLNSDMIYKSSETAKKKRAPKGMTAEFTINNELPCPICRKWVDKSNFRRHTTTIHNMTTQQMFTEFREEALSMLADYKAEQKQQ